MGFDTDATIAGVKAKEAFATCEYTDLWLLVLQESHLLAHLQPLYNSITLAN